MVDEDDIDMFSVAIQHDMNYEYTEFPIIWQVGLCDRIVTLHIDNFIERYIVLELQQDLEEAICQFGCRILAPLHTKYMVMIWNAIRHKFYKVLKPIYSYEDEYGKVRPKFIINKTFMETVANVLLY